MTQQNQSNPENATAPPAENRGHQAHMTLDKGYQASGQVVQPTQTPNVGTTAVTPVASTNATTQTSQGGSGDQK